MVIFIHHNNGSSAFHSVLGDAVLFGHRHIGLHFLQMMYYNSEKVE